MNSFNDAKSYTDLGVFECGKEECVKNKTIYLTKKVYHLFHYVVSGKGTLIINQKQYSLGRGMLFYIPPETDAIYYSDPVDPWSYEWVGFDGKHVQDYLNHLQVSGDSPIIVDTNKKYKRYFDDIVSRYVNKGYLDIFAVGSLYQFFGELLSDSRKTKDTASSKLTVQLAKDFINNNYQFDISVLDIAKNANVTPNYLSFIFNKEEGMSTKEYLIRVRMDKAVLLLKSGFFNVKEVSEKVGYKNQLHFSNEFKKIYGKSPINYVKGASEDE